MNGTKTRILDAAERLFSERGFAGTSLRHVIGNAGVNLAAVHYHFGSKEELLSAVVLRKADPVNQERLRLLAEAEERGGGAPQVEEVLRAFLAPTFRVARHNPEIVRLMGRLYGEGDVLPGVIRKNFGPVIVRFGEALRRALPELPQQEMAWRIHFAIGAMAHALRLPPITEGGAPPDPEAASERLIAFLAAGFRSPLPERARGEEA